MLGFAEQLEFLATLPDDEDLDASAAGTRSTTMLRKPPRRRATSISSTRRPTASPTGTPARPAWPSSATTSTGRPTRSTTTSRSIARPPRSPRRACCGSATTWARRAPGRRYWQAGLTVLDTLFDEPYLCTDPAHQGLILHSVYHRPNGWDHVAPRTAGALRRIEHVGRLPRPRGRAVRPARRRATSRTTPSSASAGEPVRPVERRGRRWHVSRRVALVTGASRGIGRGIALALAGAGHDVVVNYASNAEAAAEVVAELEAAGARAHAVAGRRRRGRRPAAARRRGVRARSAGSTCSSTTPGVAPSGAGRHPRRHRGVVRPGARHQPARAVLPHPARGPPDDRAGRRPARVRPKIVIVSSISAYTASVNRGDYCLAKAGLAMMTTLYAARLAEHGINVYEIRPGRHRDRHDRPGARSATTGSSRTRASPRSGAGGSRRTSAGRWWRSRPTCCRSRTGQVIDVDGGLPPAYPLRCEPLIHGPPAAIGCLRASERTRSYRDRDPQCRGPLLRGRPAAAVRPAPRRAAGRAGPSGGTRSPAPGRLDFLPETREIRESAWRCRRRRPGWSTGGSRSPGRPSARWRSTRSTPAPRSGWPTSRTPTRRTGRTSSTGRSTCTTRCAARSRSTPATASTTSWPSGPLPTIVMRPRGWHLPERHLLVDGQPAVGALVDFGLYFFHNARELARARERPVPLPAQDGEPPRGAAVERRLRPRRGRARPRPGHDPRHRAHRDDHGRVRDGRDPLGAAPARRRPERRPVGLPVQHHQELPRRRAGVRAARPRGGHDDGAVHAGLHRAAGRHLPPPRRVRDGRHGRVHPEPPRPGGQRGGAGQGARRQGARGRRRVRRLLGGPPRPGAGLRRGVRPRARRPAEPARPAPRRRPA